MRKLNQLEALKRDNLVVDYLKKASAVVSAKELANYLNENGYETKTGTIHTIISRVMYERNLPICSLNAKGYFWAYTQKDIVETIESLSGRCYEIQKHIEHLNRFIIK